MSCKIDDCDKVVQGRGLCARHYGQWRRGRLGAPRWERRKQVGEWPVAVRKIDGVWHRRPSECEPGTPWVPVVWS